MNSSRVVLLKKTQTFRPQITEDGDEDGGRNVGVFFFIKPPCIAGSP